VSRVLVVDDSLSVRKMVERSLQTKGFEVLAASSGAEAMERIGGAMPDLVVCDVVMPDIDGYRICEFVRAHPALGNTPVLLISGIVNASVLERAAHVRSNDVLRKPFTADELARKVDELLAARSRPGTSASAGALPEELVAMPDLKGMLGQLAAMPGVGLATLVDREGFLIEAAGEVGIGAEAAGALASCLAESSEGIGRELGRGMLQSMILDYESGMVVLHAVGPSAVLAVVLRDATALGKLRYYVKKILPDMLRAI
jgi:CheY-like chemotaxis protein/predicted regulator of Ras-like GTPase activity (Roadblock/LC7/MglB family)